MAKDRLNAGPSGSTRRFSRQIEAAANKAIDAAPNGESGNSAETWLAELIWREFYTAILC